LTEGREVASGLDPPRFRTDRRHCSLGSLWNFAPKLTMRKLVTGLSYSEDPMIVAGVVLTQCQRVSDGRTDGFTIASTALSIASYADAL